MTIINEGNNLAVNFILLFINKRNYMNEIMVGNLQTPVSLHCMSEGRL